MSSPIIKVTLALAAGIAMAAACAAGGGGTIGQLSALVFGVLATTLALRLRGDASGDV